MLVPRFSLRFLLLLTTACALVSYVVMCAVRGQAWAIALAVAIASLVLTLLLHALFFLLAWFLSQPWRSARHRGATREFARHASSGRRELPPQLVPPHDLE